MSSPTRCGGRAGTAPPAATPDWADGRKGRTGIVSRGRGSGGRHHKTEERRSGRHSAAPGADLDAPDDLEPEALDEGDDTGPYDMSEAPEGVERLDLGSLKVPVVEG